MATSSVVPTSPYPISGGTIGQIVVSNGQTGTWSNSMSPISAFGVKGNGNDEYKLIQDAFDQASASGVAIYMPKPPVAYAYSHALIVNGFTLYIDQTAEMRALSPNSACIQLSGQSPAVIGGQFTSPNATTRLAFVVSSAFYVDSTASDWTLERFWVKSSAECGVQIRGSHGCVNNFRIDNVLSNGIIVQNAVGEVKDLKIWAGQMNNLGDTGIEVVSYDTTPGMCRDVYAWAVFVNSSSGYGFSSIGSRNVHFRNCKAQNTGLNGVFFGFDAAVSTGGASDCSFTDGSIAQVQGTNKYGIVGLGNSTVVYSKSIASLAYNSSNGLVTASFSSGSHAFEIGDPIAATGAVQTPYNVNTRVRATTASTLTYYITGGSTSMASPATGTTSIGRSGLTRDIRIAGNTIQAETLGLNTQAGCMDWLSENNTYAECGTGILAQDITHFDSVGDRFDDTFQRCIETTSTTAGRLHIIRPRFRGSNQSNGNFQRIYVPNSAFLKDVLIDEVYDDIQPGADGGYPGGVGILIEYANARIGRYVSFSSNAVISNGSGGVLGTTMRLVGKGNTAGRPTLTKSDNDAVYIDTQTSTTVYWNVSTWV